MAKKKHERSFMRLVAGVSPRAATQVTAWLFFRTRRSPRPARERAILRAATEHGTVDGLRVWRFGADSRPTVLLVHGWNGRGGQLGAFVEPLLAEGKSVVLFDGRGHGDSPGRSASLPGLARDIVSVARWAGNVTAVVAHSMGAPSTAVALRELPNVRRAAFVSPPADPGEWIGAVSTFVGLPDELQSEVARRVERAVDRPLSSLVAEQLAASQRADLLLVHDLDDREVAWESGRRWRDAWPGATLQSTRGLGHRRILRDPDVVASVSEFVARRASTRPRPALTARVAS